MERFEVETDPSRRTGWPNVDFEKQRIMSENDGEAEGISGGRIRHDELLSSSSSPGNVGGGIDKPPMFWCKVVTAAVLVTVIVSLCMGAFAYSKRQSSFRGPPGATRVGDSGDVCTSPNCVVAAARFLTSANFSADPCEAPFNYACGTWERTFELPPEEGSWDLSFSEVFKENRVMLKQLIEQTKCDEALKDLSSDSKKWDATVFCHYEGCVNTTVLDSVGVAPLLKLIRNSFPFLWGDKDFQQPTDSKERARTLGDRYGSLRMGGVGSLLGSRVAFNTFDPKDDTNALFMFESGTGLAYRQYEQNDTVDHYRRHARNLFELFYKGVEGHVVDDRSVSLSAPGAWADGEDDDPESKRGNITRRIEDVINLEVKLKNAMLTPEESRDPVATINPIKWAEFRSLLANAIDVDAYAFHLRQAFPSDAKLTDDTTIYIDNKGFFASLSELLSKGDTSWHTLMDHTLLRVLRTYGSLLSSEWRDEFDRYALAVSGTKPPPRWRTCLSRTNGALGWVLGQQYVNAYVEPQRKVMATSILSAITHVFDEQLGKYHWMDSKTRTVARQKLKAIEQKLAYPDWLLDTRSHEYFNKYYGAPDPELMKHPVESRAYLSQADQTYSVSQYGRKKDTTLWGMTPQTINAYYSPDNNEIMFPASILREPFMYHYDPHSYTQLEKVAMTALSFGGVGAVVGHEISHGFDDSGRHYDGKGKLIDWWSEGSQKNFDEAISCVADQYSNYSVEVDLRSAATGENRKEKINLSGQLTLGENIADNGGFRIALLYAVLSYWVYVTVCVQRSEARFINN
eukprot:GHVN01073448.1.p1 GENE.GHVN01073448.1~~GHVN01073448.1.p1  ORF type:complete len:798 (+),score=82.68 GHVN01073448.1:773-3166(+)